MPDCQNIVLLRVHDNALTTTRVAEMINYVIYIRRSKEE